MTSNDAVRRQLRFSLFLQGFAALMFGAAFVVRAFAVGFDVLTVVFGVLLLLIIGAMAFTTSKLRQLA